MHRNTRSKAHHNLAVGLVLYRTDVEAVGRMSGTVVDSGIGRCSSWEQVGYRVFGWADMGIGVGQMKSYIGVDN